MIPYPYNMVDMGGIDLAEANGTVVEGLYAKIVEAVNACGDVVLYNWKFAGIEIAPQHTSILLGNPITINGAVQVTEQDLVTVPGINPDPFVLVPLAVIENGQFSPLDYDADGFSEVSVNVPVTPRILPLNVIENGEYSAGDFDAEGFDPVIVNVAGDIHTIPNAVRLTPYSEDNNTGYVSLNNWYAYQSNYSDCRSDIYELNPEDGLTRYFLIFVSAGGGNRFRILVINEDPTLIPPGEQRVVQGGWLQYHNPINSANVDNAGPFTGGVYQVTNIASKKYLCVEKTSSNIDGIKSYVIDITNTP